MLVLSVYVRLYWGFIELKRGEMAPVTVISCIVFTWIRVYVCSFIQDMEITHNIGTMGLFRKHRNKWMFFLFWDFYNIAFNGCLLGKTCSGIWLNWWFFIGIYVKFSIKGLENAWNTGTNVVLSEMYKKSRFIPSDKN